MMESRRMKTREKRSGIARPNSTASRQRKPTQPSPAPLETKQITPEEVKQRLSRSLSQIIGPRRQYSYAEAARLTHINERTLRAYVDGVACPNLARYGRLLRVFGPEVGLELALMLGWEPRAQIAEPPDVAALEALREGMARAVLAVEQSLPDSTSRTTVSNASGQPQ